MKTLLPALLFSFLFCIPAFSQEAELIDKFGTLQCDDYLARVDNPINTIKSSPSSVMYVLVYEGKEGADSKARFPTFGLATAKIRSMRELIIKLPPARKVPIERFRFIQAGFRETFTVEFWLVPEGANTPKPTPTLTKMKYRKGKPHGFCLGCCGP